MKNKTLYIYMLVDPRNDLPFYVGRSVDPKRRYADHIRDGSKYEQEGEKIDRDNKSAIIDSIMQDGELPTLTILDSCTLHDNWLNKPPGFHMLYRIMDTFEGLWASWVERHYDVWLVGKQKQMGAREGAEHSIEQYKNWLETNNAPKIPWRDPVKRLKRYQDIMEDLEKMKRGEKI